MILQGYLATLSYRMAKYQESKARSWDGWQVITETEV
jgi:hypothetical protein